MTDDSIEFEGVETNAVTVDGDRINELAHLVPPDSDYLMNTDRVEIKTDDRIIEFRANAHGQVEIKVKTEGEL